VNPLDGTALIVGNTGTALILDAEERFTNLSAPTFQNLRSVSWHQNGTVALVAGNNGTLFKYSDQEFETVEAGRANLRDISWRPNSKTALVSSNCFAEEFIPSPNLFNYDGEAGMVKPVNEGRADLIGLDWKPTGESALVVGYDIVWHNGLIGNFDGTKLSQIEFDNKHVYPVAATWKLSASLAAIVTATVEGGMARGTVILWDGKSLSPIYNDANFFFSDVAWNWSGSMLAALASTEARTFNS
jgi:WD40 repeat protein